MEDYKELFLKLAEKLGWTNVIVQEGGIMPGVFGTPPNYQDFGMSSTQRCSMPNWVMDDGAVFRLMVEHDIRLDENHEFNLCTLGPHTGEWIYTNWKAAAAKEPDSQSYHPSKYAAVRVAIVKAVIAKLGG